MDQRLALGRAIAEQRRRHGLSQADLARLLDRPAAWVSLVERGLAQAEPMPVLEAVASALGTPLPARHRPRADHARADHARADHAPADHAPADHARALRLVLSAAPQPPDGPRSPGAPQFLGAPVAFPQRPTAALREGADSSWALTREGRYEDLADLLTTLMPELNAALRDAAGPAERAELHELIAMCYQACSAALSRLGDHESAKTAASRALQAAQRGGDLPLAAAGAYLLARILMEIGRYPQAEETAKKAAAALAPLAAEGRPEAISLQGALTLLRALIAARTGDAVAAGEHLRHAREAAARLTVTRNGQDTGFGPGHVALYEIAVSVEVGERRREPSRTPA